MSISFGMVNVHVRDKPRTAPLFHCNNFVNSQPIFIISSLIHWKFATG